mgnify:CR=1 FL=1
MRPLSRRARGVHTYLRSVPGRAHGNPGRRGAGGFHDQPELCRPHGHVDSEVYLASPAVAAASAVTGYITDRLRFRHRKERAPMNAHGFVHKYGDNVDTDVIIPARYLTTSVPSELAAHCMEDIDREFIHKVKPGDIMVADKNFGCGSSREHAPIAIKAAGISVVIASTFARIFYRNAINIGLPIMECGEAARDIKAGDEVNVDFDTGVITNVTTGKTYQAQPFPPFIQNIIEKRRPAEQHPVGIGENQHRSALDSHKKRRRNNLFRAPFLLTLKRKRTPGYTGGVEKL